MLEVVVFQLASTVMSLLALVLAFVANEWAWIPCAVTTAALYLVLLGVRGKRYGPVPELSAGANELLRKFGHYYVMPFAGSEVSAAASTITLAAGAVGVVSAFKGNWWGLGIGVLIYGIASRLARQFNPTKFLVDDSEKAAHDEIVDHIRNRRT
jgi:hypothetical protein